MKIDMNTKVKNRIKGFLGFCTFLIITARVFTDITYLFRNDEYDRNHIVGIEQENVDMVYIGGSAAFAYWQPLRAWNDCGFTSYSFATDTIQAESIKAYIEEVRKTQHPKLFVIGVRAFEYYTDSFDEAGIRNSTDSMNISSVSRYKLLEEYFDNRNVEEDTDILSYYLDIAKYHGNTGKLKSADAWGYIHNTGESQTKGWEWLDRYAYLEAPVDYKTDVRTQIPPTDMKILEELLTYCKEEELNVLFVVCPFYITEEQQEKYNTIGDKIREYGFDFLNVNDNLEEVGLDFSTDFYNRNHVNLFGAAKYTEYLEKYITTNYALPDHRGEEKYSDWEEDYQQFSMDEKSHAKEVLNLKKEVEATWDIQHYMKETNELTEWWKFANDSRFTLFIAKGCEVTLPSNMEELKILSEWGIDIQDKSAISIICADRTICSYSDCEDETNNGVIDIWGSTPYCTSLKDGNIEITVADEKMNARDDEIDIILFENNYRRVVDKIVFRTDESGRVLIEKRYE